MSAPSLPSLLVTHWELSASIATPAAAAAILYGRASRRRRWPARRTASFLTGIGVIVIALQSGIDGYDAQLLSDHMVQHLLLLVVAPPLLLGGRPVLLALRALPAGRRRGFARSLDRARRFTGPVPSLGLFAVVILLTHLPAFYDATLRHPGLHDTEHALYILAGLLVWSPLLDGDPVPRHRLNGLGKLAYLIAVMMPMALIGAYLNRHAGLVYPPYGPPARTLGISALNDQAQAGAIMWVAGGVVMTARWPVGGGRGDGRPKSAGRSAREARAVSVAAPDGGSRT